MDPHSATRELKVSCHCRICSSGSAGDVCGSRVDAAGEGLAASSWNISRVILGSRTTFNFVLESHFTAGSPHRLQPDGSHLVHVTVRMSPEAHRRTVVFGGVDRWIAQRLAPSGLATGRTYQSYERTVSSSGRTSLELDASSRRCRSQVATAGPIHWLPWAPAMMNTDGRRFLADSLCADRRRVEGATDVEQADVLRMASPEIVQELDDIGVPMIAVPGERMAVEQLRFDLVSARHARVLECDRSAEITDAGLVLHAFLEQIVTEAISGGSRWHQHVRGLVQRWAAPPLQLKSLGRVLQLPEPLELIVVLHGDAPQLVASVGLSTLRFHRWARTGSRLHEILHQGGQQLLRPGKLSCDSGKVGGVAAVYSLVTWMLVVILFLLPSLTTTGTPEMVTRSGVNRFELSDELSAEVMLVDVVATHGRVLTGAALPEVSPKRDKMSDIAVVMLRTLRFTFAPPDPRACFWVPAGKSPPRSFESATYSVLVSAFSMKSYTDSSTPPILLITGGST
uniref:Uncharacterized protein n=1 Tax=Anopheles atroparvus TaxID=41427 RepID=A0A182JAH6_ANOAO